jgi:hypothetical protein
MTTYVAPRRHHRRPIIRPEPAKPTSSSSSIARAPSSPRTGNHEKGIGDGAAGDLTIESCGQLPLHRPGRSSRSSSIVELRRAAQPRGAIMVNGVPACPSGREPARGGPIPYLLDLRRHRRTHQKEQPPARPDARPRFTGPPPMDKGRPESQSEHTPVRGGVWGYCALSFCDKLPVAR